MLQGTYDLISPTRDRTHVPSIARWIFNHWTTREVPEYYKLVKRIARRDKKTFLSNQCKEIEENNIMGKTRDLVKKIRDTKGTFHAKMGSTKDRNGMDLTEAKGIKKRWQEYTE